MWPAGECACVCVCVRALMATVSLFVLLFAINNFYHIFACRNFLILPPLTAIPFRSFVVWTNLSISECPAWTTVLSSAVCSALFKSVANDFRTLIKFIVWEMTVFMGCLVCVQIYHLWSLYVVVYYYILLLIWLFKEVRKKYFFPWTIRKSIFERHPSLGCYTAWKNVFCLRWRAHCPCPAHVLDASVIGCHSHSWR